MTGKGDKERIALSRLANALTDDILSASDDDILADLRETGEDPAKNADDMRALFEKTVLIANKKRLSAAKAGAAAVREVFAAPVSPAVDIGVARARLRQIIEAPGRTQKVTLAARKESEMSDSDVLGMLDDLVELGILSRPNDADSD
ncbi:MAG: hypothetical protein KJZ75_15395 [Hyphomonadaceae bacterium]|nr:hypothetical protein [Hyphomonadaceae bacterium]GIK48871.1 MAG: hypothetical protein BroJett013_15680 [Alphaproteobacteria bacterium]